MIMTRYCSAAILTLSLISHTVAEPIPQAFNGRDLAGWAPDKHPECWRVEDGVLHLKNDAKQEGSVLWTEREYGDFIMELEFKFGSGTIDSGVFVREIDEQIQVGESGSLKRDMTGSPYISGKGYPVEANGVAESLKAEDWNAMKIMAVGPRYDVWLNGRYVMGYVSETAAERGPVGLQLHPNREMTMQYRNVRIADLQD